MRHVFFLSFASLSNAPPRRPCPVFLISKKKIIASNGCSTEENRTLLQGLFCSLRHWYVKLMRRPKQNNLCLFVFYLLKILLVETHDQRSPGGILSCGLTHCLVTPLDVVKCNVQVSRSICFHRLFLSQLSLFRQIPKSSSPLVRASSLSIAVLLPLLNLGSAPALLVSSLGTRKFPRRLLHVSNFEVSIA